MTAPSGSTTPATVLTQAGNPTTPLDPKKGFESFLIVEYTNVAQAFFNAGSVITQFFQYYLLALAVPLTATGLVIKVTSGTIDMWWLMQSGAASYLGVFFLGIGAVGVCMATYIANLRLDALLYARSVNGIRNYFYALGNLPKEQEPLIRILPRDTNRPNYFEPWFFLPVVVAFAVLNTIYIAFGLLLVGLDGKLRFAFPLIVFLAHPFIYLALVRHRDRHYLKHSQESRPIS
jgi:hypothetical protein